MRILIQYVVIILLTSILFCSKSDLEQMEKVNMKNFPDEQSKNIELIYSDSGYNKIMIKSPLINVYSKKEKYTEFPQGVEAYFYNKKNIVTSSLKSDYAIKYDKDDRVYFRKNVKVRNNKNERLFTQEMYLVKDTIYCDTDVMITTPTITLYGNKLVASADFENYILYNPRGEGIKK